MPVIESYRVSTDGSGTVTFANAATSNSVVSSNTSSPNPQNINLLTTAENIGNGVGLFVGISRDEIGDNVLDFKSIIAGIGINLIDYGSSVLIQATGEIVPQRFVTLLDGPMGFITNALLIGNATSNTVQWTAAPTINNTVLSFVNNTLTWATTTSHTPLTGSGDNAILVTTTSTTNGYSINVILENTTVVPGTYSAATISVDAQGRVTAIANTNTNTMSFTVSSDTNILVSGSPVVNQGVLNVALSNTTVVPGLYSYATVTVDQKGRINSIASNPSPLSSFNINGTTDIGITGNAVSGNVVVSLLPTSVAAGNYSVASITVDNNGRITRASNGVAISLLAMTTDNNITVTGSPVTTTGTFNVGMAATSVAAGTYSYPTLIVDRFGRLQNVVSNQSGVYSFASVPTTVSPSLIASLYAGASNGTQYFSLLEASQNIYFTANTTGGFVGQNTNSGVITLDLVNTGILPGTYNTLIMDAKGRATFGSLVNYSSVNLIGDVYGNTTTLGGFIGGTYVPPIVSTTLEEYLKDSFGNLTHSPATFTQVVVDSKGRVQTGTYAANPLSNVSMAFAGDVAGSGPIVNTIVLTLATVVAAGTYNQVTVNSKGLVVAGSLSTATFINLSGDVTAIGNATALTSVTATLATTGVAAGTYTSVSVDTKGRVLSGSNPATTVRLIGDVSGNNLSNGTTVTTLANTGVVAGTYNSLVVNSKGLVISASNVPAGVDLIGDVTGTSNAAGITTTTLATTGVTAGSYGSGSQIATFSVNAKGLVTSASNVSVTGLLGYTPLNAANTTITLTGAATGSGSFANTNTVSIALTLASSGVTAGTYGSATLIPIITVNNQGLITHTTTTSITLTNAEVVAGLGYTPVNKAGDTMTGTLVVDGTLTSNAGVYEAYQAVSGTNFNLSQASYFTKTISGNTALTVSGVPASGNVGSFLLELVNGGSASITWWSGVTWAGGTVPTLSTSGTDILAMITYDGGTIWRGLLLGKGMA